MDGETVFLGLYEVEFRGVGRRNLKKPYTTGVNRAGTYHLYDMKECAALQDLAGRLYVDWGPGKKSWIQRADRQNKPIRELKHTLEDPDFPGYVNFIQPLSRIESLPKGWNDALRSSKGVYLLSCPRTREHYIGKADGGDGFLGRLAGLCW